VERREKPRSGGEDKDDRREWRREDRMGIKRSVVPDPLTFGNR